MVGYLVLPDGKQVAARDGLILGRVAACDVVVNDTKASRRHAALRVAGTVVEIEDLDSSNGTLLNGKKVQRRVLRDGDKIQIGAWAIAYREGGAAASAAPAAGDELVFEDDSAPAPAPAVAAPPRVASPPPLPRSAPPAAPSPAPPPAPRAVSPPAPPSDTLEFLDEVVQVRTPPPPKPSIAGAGKPQAAAAKRDRGVLQFKKQADRRGLLAEDMEQMSGSKRALLVLFALAVTGVMGYLAMQLAS
jgi:hypothetical protein